MDYQNIALEKTGRVAVLTIDRQDVRNALNLATRREIAQVLDLVGQDSGIGVRGQALAIHR